MGWYFENNYVVEDDHMEYDARKVVYIDGYEDDKDEGEVVATVTLTKHDDIVVDWHLNYLRMNDGALEIIKETVANLRKEALMYDTRALEESFSAHGMTLTLLQPILKEKRDVFWYGGELATVEKDGETLYLYANGDVIGSLLTNDRTDVLDSFKDKGNNAYRHDVDQYLKNDDDLKAALLTDRLVLENNNWLEWFGNDCGYYSIVDDSDDVIDALEPSGVLELFKEFEERGIPAL